MKIVVRLYKPSGKWAYDREVDVPNDLSRLDLSGHLRYELYENDEYKWLVSVEPELQTNQRASDYVSFPMILDLNLGRS